MRLVCYVERFNLVFSRTTNSRTHHSLLVHYLQAHSQCGSSKFQFHVAGLHR